MVVTSPVESEMFFSFKTLLLIGFVGGIDLHNLDLQEECRVGLNPPFQTAHSQLSMSTDLNIICY